MYISPTVDGLKTFDNYPVNLDCVNWFHNYCSECQEDLCGDYLFSNFDSCVDCTLGTDSVWNKSQESNENNNGHRKVNVKRTRLPIHIRSSRQNIGTNNSDWYYQSSSTMGSGVSRGTKKEVTTNTIRAITPVIPVNKEATATLKRTDDCFINDDVNCNAKNSDVSKEKSPKLKAKENLHSFDTSTSYAGCASYDEGNSNPSSSSSSQSRKHNSLPENASSQDKFQVLCKTGKLCKSDTDMACACRSEVINTPPGYDIYTYLDSSLSTDGRMIDYIKGDGNCFFRALSKEIYRTQEYHFELRLSVVDLMERFSSEFQQFVDTDDFASHIKQMRAPAVWATTAEIYAAATLLERDLYVLSPNHTGKVYRWLLFSPRFPFNADAGTVSEKHQHNKCCYITLCHTNANHYDRVVLDTFACCNCSRSPPELKGKEMEIDLTESVTDINDSNSLMNKFHRSWRSET